MRHVIAGAQVRRRVPPSVRALALVVDDQEAIRRLMEAVFPRFGLDVQLAGSVSQARQLATEHHVDCAVIDLALDNESGLDVLVWLRSQPRYATTPVIILSGCAEFSADVAATMLRYGAVAINKPMSNAHLCGTLNRMLVEARMPAQPA